jgi:hypothetical protein
MLAALRTLPARSVVLLHACCHNPTGVDLTRAQWEQLIPVLRERELLPYLDLAYQGYGRGLPVAEIRPINEWAVAGCWPELVILVDVHADALHQRMHGRELDRFEREGDDFHARVRDGFRALAEAEPHRWVIVDGVGEIDMVEAAIRTAVRDRLGI